MVRTAFAFALSAMVFWGFWTATAKLATRSLVPETAMVITYATGALVALGYVFVSSDVGSLPTRGVSLALLAGLFSGIGAVSFYAGLARGDTAMVTTVSALYFVVAAVVGWALFGESLGVRDVAGIGFAIVAVALLS